jgi:glycosyltransferase involved in cell wall biosynthesis
MNKKFIVFFHGWDSSFAAAPAFHYRFLLRRLFFKADTILVLASEFGRQLERWGYRNRIATETTVVDDCLLSDIENIQGKNKQGFRILFLARIEKLKGIYESIDAYARLAKKYRDIELVVAGDGSELQAAKNYTDEKNIPNVIFKGRVEGEEKKKIFLGSDLYLFPTYHGEGMPTSILEAMAFGLPVITRKVGGIEDFFENGEMGFATASTDVAVLADLIEYIKIDENLRKRMSDYNRLYADRRFRASQVVKRIETIYEESIGLE